MLQGLASTLVEMSFVQLSLLFLVVGAYSLAINGSLGFGVRSAAASVAFASGVGFSTLATYGTSGAVFLSLAVRPFAGAAADDGILLGPARARPSRSQEHPASAPRCTHCNSCAASRPA
jgi:hypothetical protein